MVSFKPADVFKLDKYSAVVGIIQVMVDDCLMKTFVLTPRVW